MSVALITGIGGQDGSYLCEYLLAQGYVVHGVYRQRSSTFSGPDDPFRSIHSPVLLSARDRLILHPGDILDPYFILNLLRRFEISEIYHLAAQSHVHRSFELQMYTCDVNAIGTLRILQAITTLGLQEKVKIYNACSSEVYGQTSATLQDEGTAFSPVSPYAASKAFAYWLTTSARIAQGLFAVNGILFNHESPRRGLSFVTRKISHGVARISLGGLEPVRLGNLDARRDWGHARDYMKGVFRMMQCDSPDDYVLATGVTRSVRDFATCAFRVIGMQLLWIGEGAQEQAVEQETGLARVVVDKELFRPAEVPHLKGCAKMAKKKLGWTTETSFECLVKEMVENDIARLKSAGVLLQMTSKL